MVPRFSPAFIGGAFSLRCPLCFGNKWQWDGVVCCAADPQVAPAAETALTQEEELGPFLWWQVAQETA